MKRCQPGLISLLVVALLLSACSFDAAPAEREAPTTESIPSTTGSTPAAQRITITFGASEKDRALFDPLIAAFEQQNPGIHVQFFDLYSLFREGEPADRDRAVLSAVDTTLFSAAPDAYTQGLVRDLTPLANADPAFDRDDFYPSALAAAGRDAKLFMLPTSVELPLLFYNKNLWQQQGLPDPKPDWTWADLAAAAEQLATSRGDTVEVYGLADRGLKLALVGELESAGVDLGASAEQPLDDPKVVAAFERVVTLIRSGVIFSDFSPGIQYNNPDDYRAIPAEIVREQKLGIWDQEFNRFVEMPDFPVGVAPMPARMGAINVSGYLMSSGTQHPEAAWRWLSFLSRQAMPDSSSSPRTSVLPARKSLAERSGIWQRIDAENAAALNAMLARTPSQQAYDQLPPLLQELINIQPAAQAPLLDTILRGAVSGEQTVRSALRGAQRSRESFLAQQPTPASGPITVASPVSEAPEGAPTLTFGAAGIMLDQARQIASSFNANNPEVFVAVKDIGAGDALMSLARRAATSDCFAWAGPLPADLITETLDLQPLLDADASFNRADYPEALLQPYRRGVGLYGLPYTVFLRVLHYNKTVFDLASATPPSATWGMEEFISAATRLSQGTGPRRQYGFASPNLQTRDVAFFLDRSGASPVAVQGELVALNFTDPAVISALRSFLDLIRSTSPHQRLEGYIRGSFGSAAVDLIAGGRVGMWFEHSTSFLGTRAGGGQGFTWGIAAPPLKNGIAANDFYLDGFHISARSPHAQACWQWLNYLSERGPGLPGGFPARVSRVESEAFRDQAPLGAAEVYRAYRSALEGRRGADTRQEAIEGSSIDYYWFFQAIDRALQGDDLERSLADAQMLTEHFIACVQGGVEGSECAAQVDPDYRGSANAPPTSR